MRIVLWAMAALLGVAFVLSFFIDFGPLGIVFVILALAVLVIDVVTRRKRR